MKKIRVVFAGFGHPHMNGVYRDMLESPLFEIVGACEPDEKTRLAAEEKGVTFTHPDYDSLIRETDADTVAIGTYYAARGAVAIKALKAGKSILADKPLCTDLKELCEIERLSREKGLTVCLLLSLRQNPDILGAVTAIRGGIIGKVNNIIFEGEHPLNYGRRASWYFEKGKHGGTINDLAVHGIDLVRLMTGSSIETVIAAREWNAFAKEVPHFCDSAQFMLRLGSGAGVIADVSYSAPEAHGYSHPSYWHFRVFGEDGMVEFGENIKGITLYPKEGEKRALEPVKPERDMLTEFYAAVSGEINAEDYTRDMLEASRQTLLIQSKAEVI